MTPTLHRCAGRCPPRGLIRLGAARRRIDAPPAQEEVLSLRRLRRPRPRGRQLRPGKAGSALTLAHAPDAGGWM